MQRSEVERLARLRAQPAVTILLSLRHQQPGNAEDRLRLRHLRDCAVERVLRDHDRREVQPLIDLLHREIDAVDLDHPTPGLAVFASAGHAEHHRLPYPVRERAVVNEAFATRDLLVASARAERYRVLVLSLRRSLLYESAGAELHALRGHGFPVEAGLPPEADTPHRDLPIHEEQRAESYRFAFRAVHRSLAGIDSADPLPLVVVGPERDLAYFAETAGSHYARAGQVTGHHTETPAARLRELVEPVAEHYFTERRVAACDELEAAVGAHRAALGIDEVWETARQGRGRLLVVERDFAYPALVRDGRLVAADEGAEPRPEDGPLHDDAVDEIVDEVINHGGGVVVVEPDALAEHGRIGLALRY